MKEKILEIFRAAVAAADPYRAVLGALRTEGGILYAGNTPFDLRRYEKVFVVGAGKGTFPMARAVEDVLGERIDRGIIVVKYGHGGEERLRRIKVVEASHPLPDGAGVSGTSEVINLLKEADEKTLVVALLSGGASALMTAPVEGVSLEEKRLVTDALLRSGADIFELNAVRKHISRIKGGRLAELVSPGTLVALIISDVLGDRLDTIASGPTVPDATTFEDAVRVIDKYRLRKNLPASVLRHLEMGARGEIPETPKGGEFFFGNVTNLIAGNLGKSIARAVEKAGELGFDTEVVTEELKGEARAAGRRLAEKALRAKSSRKGRALCLVSGGETTVTVRGNGRGGRNQELALSFAIAIEGKEGITFLSAGTDGTDGPTDAAGACVDGKTASLARGLGIEPEAFLENNDSYAFFERLDAETGRRYHLKTGPTGTNVMDIQITVIG